MEVWWSGDDEVGHSGREDDSLRDCGLADPQQLRDLSVEHLQEEEGSGAHDPLPKVWRVQDEENPVGAVEIMGPGKDLKVAAAPNEGHGAHDHDGQHDDQDDPGRVGDAIHKAEDSGAPGQ